MQLFFSIGVGQELFQAIQVISLAASHSADGNEDWERWFPLLFIEQKQHQMQKYGRKSAGLVCDC